MILEYLPRFRAISVESVLLAKGSAVTWHSDCCSSTIIGLTIGLVLSGPQQLMHVAAGTY
jgi:hypothetical protein